MSSTDSVVVARASLVMYFFFSTSGTLAYDAARGLIDRHVLLLAATAAFDAGAGNGSHDFVVIGAGDVG